jgi:hypothetical protein
MQSRLGIRHVRRVLLTAAPFFAGSAILFGLAVSASAQTLVIGSFDPRNTPQPYERTSIPLSPDHIGVQTKLEVIRIMQSEEAFTMRALPMGRHGLVLHANGMVTPDGMDYEKVIQEYGLCAKPGGKVKVTNVRLLADRIVFDINGGPEKKHKWLQHISIGGSSGGGSGGTLAPEEAAPTGARITLVFKGYVPELTGDQVKALLRPLLDFSMKSPMKAYTDTLPPKIARAVLAHQVLVGMDEDMVLYSLGSPDRKIQEHDKNGFLYEEWVYGKPPQDMQFVRFEGDRCTRIELASVGKELLIRDKDETDGYLSGKHTAAHVRTVNEGDAPAADPTQTKAPSLRRPGETAPEDQPQPVQYPPGAQKIS